MVDACFSGMEQSDVGDETERFPRLSYGRHTLEVQEIVFNAGYRGKYFIVQHKVLASTDLAKQPVGESRVWMLKMDATHPEAQKIRRGEVALFMGVMNDFVFPQDKARFDQTLLPQVSRVLDYAISPAQPYKGKIVHCTVSWQAAKGGDPLLEGYPSIKFFPASVPVESLSFVSPPPGFKAYTKPGAAPAGAPPAQQFAPPPMPGAAPWAPPGYPAQQFAPPPMPQGYGAPTAQQYAQPSAPAPWQQPAPPPAQQFAAPPAAAPWQAPAPIAAPPPAYGLPAQAAPPWQPPAAAAPPWQPGVDPAQWAAYQATQRR